MAEDQGSSAGQSILNILNPYVQFFIRPWGRIEPYTLYLVNGRENTTTYNVVLNIAVNEERETIGVKSKHGKEIMISRGGIRSMFEMMYVESIQQPDKTAYINEKFLWDNSDNTLERQLFWDDYSTHRNFDTSRDMPIAVKKKEDFGTGNPWIASFTEQVRSSAVTVHIRVPGQSAWKKAIIIMAMIKLYYCVYKLHTHAIPNGIPHLMTPGDPLKPNIYIESISNIKLRISCVENDKTRVMEVLHEKSNEILLLIFIRQDSHQEELFHYRYTDVYGQLVMSTRNFNSKQQTVDFAGNTPIGTIYSRENVITAANGQPLFIITNAQPLWDSLNNFESKDLLLPGCMTLAAEYILDNINLFHIGMLPTLTMTHKAMAFHYGAHLALSTSNMWKSCGGSRIDKYRFRMKAYNLF